MRARRVRRGERRRRRAELLRLVALEGYDQRLPSELSGGQQQRVALARALAHEPRVLLLDEPFGALDAKIREELRRAIREIQRAVGITTILVTHDQEEAFSMADRIGVMDRGRLQEVGEPRSLYQKPGTRFVATFLGGANLLLGPYGYRDVRLGESYFDLDRWSDALRSGDEAAVVVRPEDVVLAPLRDLLSVPVVGNGKIVELKFVGASERIRLEMNATDTLASAQRPGATAFTIEAARTASDVEACRSRSARRSTSASSTCTRCRHRSAVCGSSRAATARRTSSRPRRSCSSSRSACTSSRCTTPMPRSCPSKPAGCRFWGSTTSSTWRRRSGYSSAVRAKCSCSWRKSRASSEC